MAALAAANFAAATDMTAGTSAAADFPIGQIDDIVFYIGEYPAVGANNQSVNIPTENAKYTITEIRMRTAQIATNTELTDQNNAIANNGNTVQNAAYQTGAFNHGAAYVGTTAATQTSRCWEYLIVKVSNTDTKVWAHQTEITNQAGINVFVSANYTTWNT